MLQNVDFRTDRNVSVFETNIRIVGGLISAHMFALEIMAGEGYRSGLLAMAVDLANRLLPAFDTPTGLSLGRVCTQLLIFFLAVGIARRKASGVRPVGANAVRVADCCTDGPLRAGIPIGTVNLLYGVPPGADRRC